jgi:hypothetical protein
VGKVDARPQFDGWLGQQATVEVKIVGCAVVERHDDFGLLVIGDGPTVLGLVSDALHVDEAAHLCVMEAARGQPSAAKITV